DSRLLPAGELRERRFDGRDAEVGADAPHARLEVLGEDAEAGECVLVRRLAASGRERRSRPLQLRLRRSEAAAAAQRLRDGLDAARAQAAVGSLLHGTLPRT